MPAVSQHGGHARVLHYQMGAGTTATGATTAWRVGNVLAVDAAANDINLHANGTLAPDIGAAFIAAVSSEDLQNLAVGPGNVASITAGQIARIMVPVYPFDPGTEFLFVRAYNNNDTELDLDTGFQIGDTGDLWADDATTTSIDTVDFGLDINGDGLTVTRKLDADGRDSLVTGNATVAFLAARLP